VSIDSYLDDARLPYPFCPGCGHGKILDDLNAALVRLQLDPHKVVIVTDIGCSGLSDKFFKTNAVHGLHGRSVTYATGIKLTNPQLTVIVLMGDGGCGIGGHHLINAARRNIGVAVLVFNNLNYGMTGGEHSVTTLLGANTATTWYGHLERPMDVCSTVKVNGASFVARTTTFDKGAPDIFVEAIRNDGFSLVDIWELCTAHYVPNNRFGKKELHAALSENGFSTGVLHREPRVEYSRAYRLAVQGEDGWSEDVTKLEPKYEHFISGSLSCVIAGSAGMKIGSAATMFCQGAILAGLWVTQKNDYPVMVRSGHSISEVILSQEQIRSTGIAKPDLMFVLSVEGLEKMRSQIASLTEEDVLFINARLLPVTTLARVIPIRFDGLGWKKEFWAVMCLAKVMRQVNLYALEALRDAARLRSNYAEDYLAAIEASEGLVIDMGT
jgi:pyruvate/2-oxoacid:ferredoxin oxidoreductase beta subunit